MGKGGIGSRRGTSTVGGNQPPVQALSTYGVPRTCTYCSGRSVGDRNREPRIRGRGNLKDQGWDIGLTGVGGVHGWGDRSVGKGGGEC